MRLVLRFGRYGAVAASSAASDWLVFIAMVSLLGSGGLAGLMTARLVGGLVSFLGNRHWTWNARRRMTLTRNGQRFLLLYLFSYGLSVSVFGLLTSGLQLPAYPSKLATDIGCFLINFAVMHAYVFDPDRSLRPVLAAWRRASR